MAEQHVQQWKGVKREGGIYIPYSAKLERKKTKNFPNIFKYILYFLYFFIFNQQYIDVIDILLIHEVMFHKIEWLRR